MAHWDGDAISTMAERKNSIGLLAKPTSKMSDLVGRTIDAKLKPLNLRVKILTINNGDGLLIPIAAGSKAQRELQLTASAAHSQDATHRNFHR